MWTNQTNQNCNLTCTCTHTFVDFSVCRVCCAFGWLCSSTLVLRGGWAPFAYLWHIIHIYSPQIYKYSQHCFMFTIAVMLWQILRCIHWFSILHVCFVLFFYINVDRCSDYIDLCKLSHINGRNKWIFAWVWPQQQQQLPYAFKLNIRIVHCWQTLTLLFVYC